VLYGIFPAVLLGAALSWAYMRRRRAPLAKLVAGQAAGEADVVLKDVHRFKDVYEVRGGSACCSGAGPALQAEVALEELYHLTDALRTSGLGGHMFRCASVV
jgi:pyruvate-formate lyase-activating enzyme